MTTPNRPSAFSSPRAVRPRALARDARARRQHAICAAMLCAAHLCAGAASKPKHPRPASAPSTAQILAPSAATVPDALPTDKTIYRCGNTYSPHPCGDARPLDVADARSDAQRRQADDVTARDKRLATWYEAGRRERDTVASAPAATRGRPLAPAQCVSTTMMTCVPKKPRSRTVTTAASGAVAGKSR